MPEASSWKWMGALLALGLGGGILLGRQPLPVKPPERPAEPPRAAPVLSQPSPVASEAPERRPLRYDCEKFGVKPAPACGTVPAPERELLDAARIFAVTASGCHYALGKDRRERAEQALAALRSQPTPPSATWRRALLQNAALRLEACRGPVRVKPSRKSVTALTSFRLDADELAALPRAEEQLEPWLGDAASWQRAERPVSSFHEASTGSTLSYQALTRGDDVANIGRAVVLDGKGHARVSSLVARLLLRRVAPDAVYVCIAEPDPSSQECGTARALQPIPPSEAALALAGAGGPACGACHFEGTRRSGLFGPNRGFELGADAQARAERSLSALLRD